MTQFAMGAHLKSPESPTTAAPSVPPSAPVATARALRTRRRLLGAAAVASPVLLAAGLGSDPGVLPREEPAVYLGFLAAAPAQYVASQALQLAAMLTALAGAVVVALVFRRTAPRLSATAAAFTAVGAIGGAGFVGLKLTALGLVADGALRPGAEQVWGAVQAGPAFGVLSVPLIGAVLGALLTTVLLVRGRASVGAWVAPVYLAGFVMGSGEFADAVTAAGPLVQTVATVAVVRALLAEEAV